MKYLILFFILFICNKLALPVYASDCSTSEVADNHSLIEKLSSIDFIEEHITLKHDIPGFPALQIPTFNQSSIDHLQIGGNLRIPENFSENCPYHATIAPVLIYPLMRDTLRKSVSTLQKTETFIPLNKMFEYRFREHTVFEWLQIFPQIDQIESHFTQLMTGRKSDGSEDACTWLFDIEKDWHVINGKPAPINSTRYTDALKNAYMHATNAESPTNITDIKISYIEFKFNGTEITSREFMFPTDTDSLPDYSDVPFALISPPTSCVPHHIKLCEFIFNNARDCVEADDQTKHRAIAVFSYVFSLTEPLKGGSKITNETLTRELYLRHNLDIPYDTKHIYELAQASFTFENFFERIMPAPGTLETDEWAWPSGWPLPPRDDGGL